ncbi:exopolysaccharide biosynthesis polyprenyl glycosylphosphotransferase, partial [Candidatus Peregrinibacteria bacterium]|nr:exopolysaccharide biosynthesis polyprenyl glycosylphosphotransferase [Candidatus Peregrinibacteria bacterium]
GSLSQLEYILNKKRIDKIIQTQSLQKHDEKILEICDLKHIKYSFVPDMIDVRRTNIDICMINEVPLITLKPTPLDGWGRILKRIMDVVGSLIALIIFSPIMLLTAIAIKIDSRGPILFTKLDDGSPVKRIGQYGRPFKFYKFRSMKPRTHNLRYTKLSKQNIRNDGPLTKIKDDPRITKVGKFIRKYSIDELPQLFNSLIGNMSLVGPRPHLPEEVAKYEKSHKFVLTIKPGVTGLPQVSGRSDLTFEKEVKLDRYYIENWSLLLDIKLIFRTFFTLIRGYKE